MKIVRCSLASQPNTGQRATSLLATNTTGASADMTQMSSHDTWLDRISAGTCGRTLADLADPHPDQRAQHAMIPMRNDPLQPQVEGDAD